MNTLPVYPHQQTSHGLPDHTEDIGFAATEEDAMALIIDHLECFDSEDHVVRVSIPGFGDAWFVSEDF